VGAVFGVRGGLVMVDHWVSSWVGSPPQQTVFAIRKKGGSEWRSIGDQIVDIFVKLSRNFSDQDLKGG